ncbi:MAG: protein translocase subunit SecD [Verrucomicrobiota bacterium]
MNPALTFLSGLVALIIFGWYLATDFPRRKRILGTTLSLLVLWVCTESIYPPKEKIRLGLDLQGGTSFLIKLEKEAGQEVNKAVLDQAVEVIRKRVDKFGVSEPVITPEGNDRILVQIPGLDAEKIAEARQTLQQVAKLEFRLVHPQSDQLIPRIKAGQEPVPPGYRIETEKNVRDGKESESELLVRTRADITGNMVKSGYPIFDQRGWGVGLQFTSEGGDLFFKLTSEHVHERFAIVLDGKIQSAPVIQDAIPNGTASITGHFSETEARNLASVLENPLAVPVSIEEQRSASSTLGADSIKSGIVAGIGGLVLVLLFVAFYYRLVAGTIAILALLVNIVILIGAMAMFNFVLTLPGIAGIILTIGLAVDANVLIFERLREELAAGKSFPASIEGAYSKAFSVIFDANATTLITAAILFWKAAGPIKGFAITLTMGVIASVFTAMIVGRNCFDWAISAGGLKGVSMLHLISDKRNINFMGRRRLWISISVAVIVVSMSVFAYRGEKNFGIDFKGGDLLMLEVKNDVTEGQVRNATGNHPDWVIQKEHEATSNRDYISIRSPLGTAKTIQEQQLLQKGLPEGSFKISKSDSVGTIVGGELAKSSVIALVLGMLGILIFVSARFEFSFAIGALVAVLHDVIITVGLFAVFGRELSLVMVGAILTIAGYSINDTIVVYDRIREGLHSGRKGSIQEIMNASINETLSRTLLTSGLTFLSVAALYFFGGPVLQDFAFAILIGIIVGTYSSIFIASPIVLWWSRRGGQNLASEVKKKIAPPVQA